MPNNMPPLNEDVTIVGMGHISKNRKNPTKLQYALVKQITANQCFKKVYPMKKIPENLSNVENQGFCVRGKNKELLCEGDSGSPAIWKNKNGVEYLIGIAFFGQDDFKCGRSLMWSQKVLPKISVQPSRYVTIPGNIFEWIEEKGGKEMEKMINNC